VAGAGGAPAGCVAAARTVKTNVDRLPTTRSTYDTAAYPMHAVFAQRYIDHPLDMPFVDEYFLPQRRFLLGAVTHYEDPDVWAYEIAPYDTVSADLIAQAFRLLAGAVYFGARLRHLTPEEQAARARSCPATCRACRLTKSADALTLNLGETYRAPGSTPRL
jgi:hypothetical protein